MLSVCKVLNPITVADAPAETVSVEEIKSSNPTLPTLHLL